MSLTFTYTEIISIGVSVLLGIVSIVLGIFAIWLTLHLKKESDAVNSDTKKLLMDIRTDSKAITSGVMNEMRAWGEAGRKSMQQNSGTSSSIEGFSGTENSHSTSKSVRVSAEEIKPIKLD